MEDLSIAVVGATGAVGQEFINIVETRYPKANNLRLLASERSAGKIISVNGKDLKVEETTEESFKGCLLYTSPSPRDATLSRMPSSA